MSPELKVHFEVKREKSQEMKKFFDPEFIMFDSDGKVSVEVPHDWIGFKNGTIRQILKFFNKDVYIGLAFITDRSEYVVTDFDGTPIPPFEDVVDKRKVYRYVKKRLSIISEVNKKDDSFEVKRYLLNVQYVNPIVKVLDVYSVSSQSGITSEMFK